MDIQILSETQIEVYSTPDKRIKQQVITYLAEGIAPHTLWIDSAKLPDSAFALANPGKPVPDNLKAQGDALRRAAIEADVKLRTQAPQPRKI